MRRRIANNQSARRWWLFWATILCLPFPSIAHDMPYSYVDLRFSTAQIDVKVEAPAIDFAHDLPSVTPDMLLTPGGAQKHGKTLAAILTSRLTLSAGGRRLKPDLLSIEPLPERKDLRLLLRYDRGQAPDAALQVRGRLFPYDARHKTYLNLYDGKRLERQVIFEGDRMQLEHRPGSHQAVWSVLREFFAQGIRHIFIGPDHILFIVSLLLLGGTLKHLLKIVTAFTLAHSLTLALATLGLVSPPARLVEPAIALSIVLVGVHTLLARRGQHDSRLLFAFLFGLIHGFGFANVLRELDLPRAALGWSLFSFNAGVEVGQACIVLAVAPLVALIHRRSERAGRLVVIASSWGVVLAGAYWLGQRLAP